MDIEWPTGPAQPLGEHPQLPRILALVRTLVRELARRKIHALPGLTDASDLAQSVVVQLLEHRDRIEYRGEKATKALVREILIRLVAQRLRAARTKKRDRARELTIPSSDDSRPASPVPSTRKGTGPASVVCNRELIERSLRQREHLSAAEREVLRRRDDGESHRQIAAALGISETYSQRLLADAKKKLQA